MHARAAIALFPMLSANQERTRREFDLLSTLVRAAIVVEGWGSGEVSKTFQQMVELAAELDDEARVRALRGLWVDYDATARHTEALDVARQVIELAKRDGSPNALADALLIESFSLNLSGRVGEALVSANAAIAACTDGSDSFSNEGLDLQVFIESMASMTVCVAGYPDRAAELVGSAI
jgi:hypothetical protein